MALQQVEQLDLEALLMLYAAKELAPAEQEAVEARLATEPALAGRLAALSAAQEVCFAALSSADEQRRLPMSEGVAVRRVGRAMRQWHVRRTLAPKVAAAPIRRRVPWWAYPSASAAAILIGFLVWSVRQPVRAVMPPDPRFTSYAEAQEAELANWMGESLRSRADVAADNEFVSSFSPPPRLSDMDGVFLREESDQ